MKKNLVTGAGGFIGSHLVEALLNRGEQVRALVWYNIRGDWENLEYIADSFKGQLEVVLGDVTDKGFVDSVVRNCHTVYHLAALIGIPYSYVAPGAYVNTNVLGTLNILDACRNAEVSRLVVTSTSEVYGTARFSPITEEHPLQGQSPYSASKIGADKLAESYYASFDLPVVIARPFNTYGPRQSARAIIPTILSQALSGAEEIVLGSLDPKRDMMYVEDTVRGFLAAGTTPGIEGQTIHFGTGIAVSIGQLAELCLKVANSNARLVVSTDRIRPEKSEVGLLLCDARKAQELLNWHPTVSLEDGLERVCEFVRSNPALFKSNHYNI